MNYKWIGAIFILFSCGGFGLHLAHNHRREEATLRQLVSALDFMECELQFHLTPLPELCRRAGMESGGCVRSILLALSREMDAQIAPEVSTCMQAALSAFPELPPKTTQVLEKLGHNLGRFDLSGQLKGLEAIRSECRKTLEELANNQDQRLRSYQTLGFCAGAALVILLV